LNEVLAKLNELESQVNSIKDWKQQYEEDKHKWDEEKQELQKRADGVLKLREVLIQLLGLDAVSAPIPVQSSKETLNLKHKEMVVNLAHEEKELNMTTGTVMGKVLFCALTELSKEGFSEAELSEILKEHGWNVLHNTLAPTLGGLVRDGYLVKLEGIKPAKYRLPEKVKLNVSGEAG
jgi:uncharacterized protein YPO0396